MHRQAAGARAALPALQPHHPPRHEGARLCCAVLCCACWLHVWSWLCVCVLCGAFMSHAVACAATRAPVWVLVCTPSPPCPGHHPIATFLNSLHIRCTAHTHHTHTHTHTHVIHVSHVTHAHTAPKHPHRSRRRGQALRLWLCARHVLQHYGAYEHQGHAAVHGAHAPLALPPPQRAAGRAARRKG